MKGKEDNGKKERGENRKNRGYSLNFNLTI